MLRILGAMLSVIFAAGCHTSKTQTFEGHQPEAVWTAMLTVANTPDYQTGPPADRWTVRENRVWVEPGTNRIEIFRRLERILYQPASSPRYEDRQWKFQVTLEERDPPTVVFFSRELGVPSHAWDEADRLFDEVRDVLIGERVIEPPPELPVDPAQPTDGHRYD